MKTLSWQDCFGLAWGVAEIISHCRVQQTNLLYLYGVPRGGIYAALLVAAKLDHVVLVDSPDECDIIIDDLIDSGRTMERHRQYDKPFLALLSKKPGDDWIQFPWELAQQETGPQDAIVRLLQFIGEDPLREGLKETPNRVIRAYRDDLFSGYAASPADVIKAFEDGACDEMVILKGIEFASMCVAGSTFVETPKGRVPIQYLKDGTFIYCWDEDKCRVAIARAFNPRVTRRNQQLWRVYTDKDTLLCTADHRILTHTRGWVEAKDLEGGDSIVAVNRGCYDNRPKLIWTGLRSAIDEHRFIYEEVNGPIAPRHHIHHIDKNHFNNCPTNLTMLSASEHSRLHRLEDGPTGFQLFTDAQRRAMRAKQIEGIRASQKEEVRKKRAASVKRYWDSLTPEERAARNHKVFYVEPTDWHEDVWCMDVPGYENFVANGMVVHNCEHHMLPFVGVAHIGYVPDKKVIGLSKLARLLDIFSKRLQIQERLCQQVTQALDEHLQPLGSACILEAKHLCMSCRGVMKQNSVMVTSSLTGCFRHDAQARQELLNIIRS